jgi:hypothetical protein
VPGTAPVPVPAGTSPVLTAPAAPAPAAPGAAWLTAHGWRTATAAAGTPLATVWQELALAARSLGSGRETSAPGRVS